MVQIQMKVGPKGQVVIPKVFREEFSIMPGSKVVLTETKEGILVEKPKTSGIEAFIELCKSIKIKVNKIDFDKEYEEEIMERWRRSQ